MRTHLAILQHQLGPPPTPLFCLLVRIHQYFETAKLRAYPRCCRGSDSLDFLEHQFEYIAWSLTFLDTVCRAEGEVGFGQEFVLCHQLVILTLNWVVTYGSNRNIACEVEYPIFYVFRLFDCSSAPSLVANKSEHTMNEESPVLHLEPQ